MLIMFRALLILYGAVEIYIMMLSTHVHIYLQLLGCVVQTISVRNAEIALNKTFLSHIFFISTNI